MGDEASARRPHPAPWALGEHALELNPLGAGEAEHARACASCGRTLDALRAGHRRLIDSDPLHRTHAPSVPRAQLVELVGGLLSEVTSGHLHRRIGDCRVCACRLRALRAQWAAWTDALSRVG